MGDRRNVSKFFLAVLLGACTLLACTGDIASSGGTNPGAGTGGSGAGAGGDAGGGNVINAPPAVVVGPTSGRRLTRSEYINTLADRFGQAVVAAAGANRLPNDQAPEGAFRNDFRARVPSEQHITAYADIGAAVAAAVPWTQLATYSSCAMPAAACQNEFISRLGRVMYRRPLIDAEVTNLSRVYEASKMDPTPFQTGSRLVLEAMLQSPNFLYQLEVLRELAPGKPAPPGAFEMATRMSLLLWKAAPDGKLLDAAAQGAMDSADAIATSMNAMLTDPRARRGAREFTDDWLHLYANLDRSPLPAVNLTSTLLADMREETLRFIERIAFDDKADLMQMFRSKTTELSPELARLYGRTPTGNATAVYDLTADPNRVGLLTQAAVLGVRAGPGSASLVKRGLTILKDFTCGDIPPPPDNVAIKLQDVPETLPERERFAMHNQFGASCAGCHSVIDPFGFAFLSYDLAGKFVTTDTHGNAIDPSGELSLDGQTQPYKNAADFSAIIARSATVERCLVGKYLGYALGRVPTPADLLVVNQAIAQFRGEGRQFPSLVSVVATHPLFRSPGPEMFP